MARWNVIATRVRAARERVLAPPRRRRFVVAAATSLLVAAVVLTVPVSGGPASGVAGGAGGRALVDPALADPGLGGLDSANRGLRGWSATGHELAVGGLKRGYLVVRPTLAAPGPMPVVVMLHGRGMTPTAMVRRAGLLSMRDVVLVVPAGYGRSWNAGDCCAAARRAHVDDVGFVSAVVQQVLRLQPGTDPHQVYLIGYSNGGRMAYRMACQRPGLFAGVAAIEAVPMDACRTVGRPVSLLVVASTADPLLRLTDAAPPRRIEGSPQPSVEGAVAVWRALDGCTGDPRRTVTGGLTSQVWTSCRGGSRVGYDTYLGGSHAWPAGSATTPGALWQIWSFLRPEAVPEGPA